MAVSRKVVASIVSSLIIIVALILLAQFYSQNNPLTINETRGDSVIYIGASRDTVLFFGECLDVAWDISNIQAVYIYEPDNLMGTTGISDLNFCIDSENSNPALQVDFPDGTSEIFTLEITRLYQSATVIFFVYLVLLVSAILAYYLWGISLSLVVLSIASVSPILIKNVYVQSDFLTHVDWTSLAQQSGNYQNLPPHAVFHFAVLTLSTILPSFSLETVTFLVVLSAQVGTILGLYYIFIKLDARTQQNTYLQFVYAMLALMLIWVGPIGDYSEGIRMASAYLFPNTYHSPTMIVMRLFSVWLFLALITPPTTLSKRTMLYLMAIAVLLGLSTFSKPNYTLVIVPAYLVIIGIQFLKERRVSKVSILVATTLIITAVVCLAWLYILAFNPESSNVVAQEDSGIFLSLFGLYRLWDITAQSLVVQWLMSLLFPLSVYVLYIKQAWKDDTLNLAWISLFGALLMALLFIETPRTTDGNFVWGTRITTLIVFAMSVSFLYRQPQQLSKFYRDKRFIICNVILLLHFAVHGMVILNYMMT